MFLSSAHGLTDLLQPPLRLTPYLAVLFPLPSPTVTVLFLYASVLHFGTDIGFRYSAAFHALLLVMRLIEHEQAAWCVLCLYMWLVHLPRHVMSSTAAQNSLSAVAAFVMLWFVPDTGAIVLHELHQKLIVAHVLVNHRVRLPRCIFFRKGQ